MAPRPKTIVVPWTPSDAQLRLAHVMLKPAEDILIARLAATTADTALMTAKNTYKSTLAQTVGVSVTRLSFSAIMCKNKFTSFHVFNLDDPKKSCVFCGSGRDEANPHDGDNRAHSIEAENGDND